MPAKNPRSNAEDDSGSALVAPLNVLADLPRRQLALLTQQTSALLRGSEAVSKIQQQAAHRASLHNEEVMERLRDPGSLNDLIAIQTESMRFTLQEAAQYWQQLTTAALRLQGEMVGSAGEMLETGEPSLDSLQRAFAASLHGNTGAAATH